MAERTTDDIMNDITEFVFLINRHNPQVTICAPVDVLEEYEDSYELCVGGGYGKYFPKSDWRHIDRDADIEAEETYDFD